MGDAPSPVVAVVLAAGAGTRLRPLTDVLPKALCPVNNAALVDLAIERVRPLTADVAVNVHHGRELLEAHLAGRVHVSVEEPEALGTAGALGNLRDWIDGRPAVVVNADAWHRFDLSALLHGWDGERVRLLVVEDPARGDFGPWRFCGASLLPWAEIERLPATPAGLYELCWGPRWAEGRLELVPCEGPFFDCGTPADYLAANLAASGGRSVVGDGARVEGELVRSVVWPGGVVRRGERLVDCIRVGETLTVQTGAEQGFHVVPIGRVESSLADVATAPKQGHEGAPEAVLVFEPDVADGLRDLHVGDRIAVLTWLDRARRDVLRVHPRDDLSHPELGVFSTRSADRPNPIGLHPTEVVAVDGLRIRVRGLEAVDRTPIVDVKPVLDTDG